MSGTQITLQDLYKKSTNLGSNDLILDVRNPDEFAAGHIENARNIPLPEVAQYVAELKKYDHVYIHCKRGGRAKTAFESLKNAGLNNIVCIFDAGMDAWIENGYPVKKD
jgi:rhodanese-related sulfurtransferase